MGLKMFKNTTKRQKLVMYFNENGFERVDSVTGKYIVFKETHSNKHYFIGKSGAVRINGKRNAVAGSRSNTIGYNKIIEDWSNKFDPFEKVAV